MRPRSSASLARTAYTCLAILVVVVAFGCDTARTSVKVTVHAPASSPPTTLELSFGDKVSRVDAEPSVVVLVPDAFAGQTLTLEVAGLRGEQKTSHGSAPVTFVLHEEVAVEVTLVAVPCGAWCTVGTRACAGDAVVRCAERAADGCREWVPDAACQTDAPSCSLGTCMTSCVDECATGETRCDGPLAVRRCGQGDSDACNDWLPAVACDAGQVCSNGHCAATCRDECTRGETTCIGGGTSTCDDLDGDGCLEWGPMIACASGESCSGGACRVGCTDECTGGTQCDGTRVRTCGNFDLDDCKDLSPGTSCVPADPCLEGSCNGGACVTAPLVCEAPPPSSCIDASTFRTYDPVGACGVDGACSYVSRDIACTSCPACDPCTGVTCSTPPATTCSSPTMLRSYAASGTCSAGSCTYATTDTPCPRGCSNGACKVDTPVWKVEASAPIPSKASLRAVWGSGPSDLYAVGDDGLILHSTGNGVWAAQTSGVGANLFAVWGSGASDVYAVGDNTILHSTGNGVWVSFGSSFTLSTLTGVWGTGPNNVYVAGWSGVFHSTGDGQWTQQLSSLQTLPGADSFLLHGIWGSSATDLYAVGVVNTLGGTCASCAVIARSTGNGAWTAKTLTKMELQAVWGSGPADIYAVGSGGIQHSTTGSTWTAQTSPIQRAYGVWGSSATDVYVVGAEGIAHSTGNGTWTMQAVGARTAVTSIWGTSGGKLYATSVYTMLEAAQPAAPFDAVFSGHDLLGVWGSSPTDVYAVGALGFLSRTTGDGAWKVQDLTGFKDLVGVWGSGPTDVYALAAGSIYRKTGAGTFVSGSSAPTLNGMWGSAANNVYAVGPARIVRSSGNDVYNMETISTTKTLRAIWGSSATDIYAVGDGGTLLHSTGAGVWTAQTSGTTYDLYAVWGSSASDVYAVGALGIVLHSTGGGAWTPQPVSVTTDLHGIWGSAAADVFVVGQGGTILHSSGTGTWTVEASPTSADLAAVWGSGPTDLYAVGARGTILRAH